MENLQVFSALEDNTISNSFSLERAAVHNVEDCVGLILPKKNFPTPPLTRTAVEITTDVRMGQNGNCKWKREVWEQHSRVAALVLPTHLWFTA